MQYDASFLLYQLQYSADYETGILSNMPHPGAIKPTTPHFVLR